MIFSIFDELISMKIGRCFYLNRERDDRRFKRNCPRTSAIEREMEGTIAFDVV